MADHNLKDLSRKSHNSDHEVTAPDEPRFPVSMFLSKEEIETLGLFGAVVGDNFLMVAEVKVTAVSASENEVGGTHVDMTLTVRKAEMTPAASDRTLAQRLFNRD